MYRLKFIILIIAFSLFSLNCGKEKKDDRIEIVFWHSLVSSTVPALNELVSKFEEENPNIKIVAQYIPSGDALIQKLITAVQSNTAPDISWLHTDFLEDLVEADAIYKIRDFMKDDTTLTEEDIKDIYPALIQFSSWRGTLYSLPMEATNLALLYNKDLFRKAGLDPNKPPKTWDELYRFAKKLSIDKNNDGNFEQTGFYLPIYPAAGPLSGWMEWQFIPFIWQAGGYIISTDQSKVLYDSEAGVKALSLWQNIFNELNLRKFTQDFEVVFASGKLAMAMDGPWNLPRYKDILQNIDWAFAPLPAGPAKSATVVGGEYLSIFKQSKHPKEAWKFLKWMIRPDVQAFWAMKSGYLPVRHSVKDIPEFKNYLNEHKNFKVFVDQMDVGQIQRPIDYGGLEISRHISEAVEKATIGKMDPKKALDQSAAKSNKILESYVKK